MQVKAWKNRPNALGQGSLSGDRDMRMTTKTIHKMCAAAGILVLSACASAFPVDAQILIDRALNSPTLTVRYSGAKAALVELRINGESIGTRSVMAGKSSGETNFTIDLDALKDGDNTVEVRLFDRTGKLVGSDKTNISTDQTERGPIFLAYPKVGATVSGPVEIKVGFGKELRNAYVSFFIDEQFKSMTNFPPYTFTWDSTRDTNGWHEVEAWVVDETSQTLKTRKVRIFVNNPGGRTERVGVAGDLTTATAPVRANVVGAVAGMKSTMPKVGAVAAGHAVRNTVPAVSGSVVANPVRGTKVGSFSGIKPLPAATYAVSGARNLTPTGRRVAVMPAAPKTTVVPKAPVAKVEPSIIKISVSPTVTKVTPATQALVARVEPPKANFITPVKSVASATTMVAITKGQHIPNLGSFAVVLNNQFVKFDVQPRVDDGVPMTPFRHLIEKAGGKVDWENLTKSVKANADGRSILLSIGDTSAKINELTINLEVAPYLDRGRTIVPLSFIREALKVNVEYDKATNHVLITSAK